MKNEEIILKHLENYGIITTKQAYDLYGNTRLSAYIHILRNKGYQIEDEWLKGKDRFGKPTNYKKYILKES